MKYEQLGQEKRDEIIAEQMHGREMEHFHHELNASVYAEALKTLPPGEWRDRISQLHDEALVEMEKIDGIHAALSAQLTDKTRRANAVNKAAENRSIQETNTLQVK